MINSFVRSSILIIALSACTPPQEDRAFSIQNGAGESFASISISDEIAVSTPSYVLQSVTKRTDKRKYYNSSNAMVFAVKMDDDGFKLRDQNENLLWKIKLYPDKLKISNNEEMTNAYELKLKEEGRLKLEKNDVEVTQVRLMPKADQYELNDFVLKGFGESIAPGVLLINDIPGEQQAIIIAELLYRGR